MESLRAKRWGLKVLLLALSVCLKAEPSLEELTLSVKAATDYEEFSADVEVRNGFVGASFNALKAVHYHLQIEKGKTTVKYPSGLKAVFLEKSVLFENATGETRKDYSGSISSHLSLAPLGFDSFLAKAAGSLVKKTDNESTDFPNVYEVTLYSGNDSNRVKTSEFRISYPTGYILESSMFDSSGKQRVVRVVNSKPRKEGRWIVPQEIRIHSLSGSNKSEVILEISLSNLRFENEGH